MASDIITAIVPSPRRPGRFSVSVDGRVVAVLSLESVERLQLSPGKSVAGLQQELEREAGAVKVFDRALNMLALRARSSQELSRSLVRKGEEKALVDRAIEKLTEQGLLDDAAFAESFTRSKVLGAKQSRRRVQQELAKRGVARDVSDAAIATVFRDEEIDQREVVVETARKKLRSLAKYEPMVRRRRLYAFLARRGYDMEDIRAAMSEVGEELE